MNAIRPFEINVSADIRREAFEALTIEMGLGRQLGSDVTGSVEEAPRVVTPRGTNWGKWTALGVGVVALTAATGGLALAAAPGVAGAAVITSALAGPGRPMRWVRCSVGAVDQLRRAATTPRARRSRVKEPDGQR